MSRRKTTGRYRTREELCNAVWWHYLGNQNTKQTDVARACRVSQSTVAMILNSKEGYEQFRRERNGMET